MTQLSYWYQYQFFVVNQPEPILRVTHCDANTWVRCFWRRRMVWLLRQREWRLQLQSMWSQRGSGNITSTLASPLFFCLYILKWHFIYLFFLFPSTTSHKWPQCWLRTQTSRSEWSPLTLADGLFTVRTSHLIQNKGESLKVDRSQSTPTFFYWLVPLQKDAGCKVVDQCSPLTASHWWLSTCARPPSRDNHATLRNRIIYVNDVWMNDCWHLIRIYYLPHTTTNTPYCTPNRELVMEKDWEAFIEQVRECS